jgi:hypothetical protein
MLDMKMRGILSQSDALECCNMGVQYQPSRSDFRSAFNFKSRRGSFCSRSRSRSLSLTLLSMHEDEGRMDRKPWPMRKTHSMPPLIGGGASRRSQTQSHSCTLQRFPPYLSIQRLLSTPLDRSCQAEDRLCQNTLSFCEEVIGEVTRGGRECTESGGGD